MRIYKRTQSIKEQAQKLLTYPSKFLHSVNLSCCEESELDKKTQRSLSIYIVHITDETSMSMGNQDLSHT